MVPQASAGGGQPRGGLGGDRRHAPRGGEVVAGDSQKKGSPFRHEVKQRVRSSGSECDRENYARIRVNRGNLPAIKLWYCLCQLSRRGGSSRARQSVLKIGAYFHSGTFYSAMVNGCWQACYATRERAKPLPD